MKDFIFVPGAAINPAAISHVRYADDGSVVVAVGSDSIRLEAGSDGAKVFIDAQPKAAEPKADAGDDDQKRPHKTK